MPDPGSLAPLADRWPFALGLAVLTVATVGLQRWAGVGLTRPTVVSILRATAQLAIVAVALSGILAGPWTVALFLLLMVSTASWTSARRLHELHRGRLAALLGVLAGAAVTIALVFGLRMMDPTVRNLVSVGGIVIGNCMTAATLSGRNFLARSRDHAAEIEGWLSLGATPQQAHADVGRHALREMRLPSIDQTSATGIVTLPGAFVGAIMGGASPLDAAVFQLVVLAGIALAGTIVGIVVTRVAGGSPTIPAPAD